MAGALDQAAIAAFLFSRLSTDEDVAALLGEDETARIYRDMAPQDDEGNLDTINPFLLFSFNSARIRRGSGHRQRILGQHLVLVQAVDDLPEERANFERAEAVMQAVDASLCGDDANGYVTVGDTSLYVNVVGAENEFSRTDFARGRSWAYVEKLYLVHVEGG